MRDVDFSRFYVEEEDFERYKELEADESFALTHHPEVFLLSACLGYEFGLREELERPKALTLRSSFLNLEGAPEIYDAFRIIARKENFVDADGGLRVNGLIEQFAKGGFSKLYRDVVAGQAAKNQALVNYMMLKLEPE